MNACCVILCVLAGLAVLAGVAFALFLVTNYRNSNGVIRPRGKK